MGVTSLLPLKKSSFCSDSQRCSRFSSSPRTPPTPELTRLPSRPSTHHELEGILNGPYYQALMGHILLRRPAGLRANQERGVTGTWGPWGGWEAQGRWRGILKYFY
jgi:hypothetical protein